METRALVASGARTVTLSEKTASFCDRVTGIAYANVERR